MKTKITMKEWNELYEKYEKLRESQRPISKLERIIELENRVNKLASNNINAIRNIRWITNKNLSLEEIGLSMVQDRVLKLFQIIGKLLENTNH